MRNHADSDRLAHALARCHPFTIPWIGNVFRSALVRYANRDDFLTGAGAKAAGARWNPPDSFAATYTSLPPGDGDNGGTGQRQPFPSPC